MSGLLDYTAGSTILHRLHPLTKIALAISICVAAFLSSNIIYLLILLAFSISLGLIGGIRKKTLSLVFGLIKISVFLFILQLLFVRAGTPLFLFVTDEGLRIALIVVLRLMTATIPLALMLALMLALTQMSDLSNALVKVARLPYRYAFTITTALRFIPVFTGEMTSIIESQTARGVNFDTKNPLRKLRLMMPLCVPLLITSVGRTEQAAMAAEVRGFYLRDRLSGSKKYPFKAQDLGALLIMILLVSFALMF
jgi:energy-coupling factor transport system permease protein